MQMRKPLAAAVAVTATACAATVALGTNLGLFGLTNEPTRPGSFGPTAKGPRGATPAVATERTEVVDVAVPYYVSDGAPDDGSAGVGAPVAPGVAPTASNGTSAGVSSGRPGSAVVASTSAPTAAVSLPPPTGQHEVTEIHAPETPVTETHAPETHASEGEH